MQPQKINILCAITAKSDNQQITDGVETVFIPAVQRGVWNKTHLTWWVKGDQTDELFEKRENYVTKVFNIAFTEIDIEIPIVFTRATSEEVADIIIEFGPKEGDKWYPGDKSKNVLAYAGYADTILKGYMKIFTDWDWQVFGSLNIVSVVIHELLHILGRPHSERGHEYNDIMNPYIRSNITELSEFDILGLTLAYGTRVYARDEHHDRLEKANQRQKVRLMLDALDPTWND